MERWNFEKKKKKQLQKIYLFLVLCMRLSSSVFFRNQLQIFSSGLSHLKQIPMWSGINQMTAFGVLKPIFLWHVDTDAWVVNCTGLFFRCPRAGADVLNRAILLVSRALHFVYIQTTGTCWPFWTILFFPPTKLTRSMPAYDLSWNNYNCFIQTAWPVFKGFCLFWLTFIQPRNWYQFRVFRGGTYEKAIDEIKLCEMVKMY